VRRGLGPSVGDRNPYGNVHNFILRPRERALDDRNQGEVPPSWCAPVDDCAAGPCTLPDVANGERGVIDIEHAKGSEPATARTSGGTIKRVVSGVVIIWATPDMLRQKLIDEHDGQPGVVVAVACLEERHSAQNRDRRYKQHGVDVEKAGRAADSWGASPA
jgi:hypothetical protein